MQDWILRALALEAVLSLACMALAIYWLARGYIWDAKNRDKAIRNAKFDAVVALALLLPLYVIVGMNARSCWLDGTFELPGLSYRCVDGVSKKHVKEFDWR